MFLVFVLYLGKFNTVSNFSCLGPVVMKLLIYFHTEREQGSFCAEHGLPEACWLLPRKIKSLPVVLCKYKEMRSKHTIHLTNGWRQTSWSYYEKIINSSVSSDAAHRSEVRGCKYRDTEISDGIASCFSCPIIGQEKWIFPMHFH